MKDGEAHGHGGAVYSLKEMARVMNLLPMVVWDRASSRGSRTSVYGWIQRDDGRSDFVVLFFTSSGYGYVTSSAKYTGEIGRLLGMTGETHAPCVRVEDLFGDVVTRLVELGRGAPARAEAPGGGGDARPSQLGLFDPPPGRQYLEGA